MTRAERLAILGPETVAKIHARVALAPEPSAELVEHLRRIMTNPGGAIPKTRPASSSEQPAADAA
jgi:hypothetical protein